LISAHLPPPVITDSTAAAMSVASLAPEDKIVFD
jgi:hypothetical protein